jgi:lysophospholipase L1-like esterase
VSVDPFAAIARVIGSQLGPEVRREQLSLYVALGDSFTAGTGCPEGRAWPERLATGIRAYNPQFAFRNLAVEGATSDEVLAQLPEAIELEPDLVTVVCGANDVLRSTRPDAAAYARRLASIFGRLQDANPVARIVTATAPERWDFLELGPRTRTRVETGVARFNRATRGVARAYAVPCLEVAGHPGLSQGENFSADGLHPSALGHERAARGFAAVLRERFGISITIGVEADEHDDP